MKNIFVILLSLNLFLVTFSTESSERTRKLMSSDTTERLENIKDMRQSIRAMKLRLKNFAIAIEDAKKKPAGYRTTYLYVKKFSEVITTLSLLVVTVEAYRTQELGLNKMVKPASVIASISSAVSGVAGVLADLSSNELEILNNKVKELNAELSATEKNLSHETQVLCSQEPSNQMCLNFVQK
jgi:hypothetical protein